MASLLAKDAYLQGLARRICARPGPEPRERRRGAKARAPGAAGPPTKKRKKAQKSRQRNEKAARPQVPSPGQESPTTPGGRTAAAAQRDVSRSAGAPAGSAASEPESLFALDVLRQRLHEKIQQARGQDQKELSAAALEKRRRRKQERERKKRKLKELRAREKEKAAGPQAAAGASAPPAAPDVPGPEPPKAQGGSELLFNKVEVRSDEPRSKAQRRKERRARLKGKLTPLTGRNYRQLLERLQARRERVQELREQDAGRARELQARMQWTNLLYKAEGVKIRDDEQRLQEALKRKQRRRAQRERAWQGRTARVVQGMQQRQERRRQSLRRRKAARAARRLDKARKKGRVLPQDLERAGLVN